MPAPSPTLEPPPAPRSALQRPRWTERPAIALLSAAAVFAVLTAIFFLPVLTQDKTLSAIAGHQSIQWPWAAAPTGFADQVQSDQANNVYPIQADINRSIRKGEFPYWSQYSFAGGPTLGTVYGIGFYPPRMLPSLVLAPIQVHDLLLLVHVWLAGMATFLLVRRLGGSWLAGVIAGTAWMFCPGWFGLAILEGPAVVAALMPLSLWAMHRAVVRHSVADAVACGVILALFVLGGSVQPAVFCFSIVCLWGVLLGVERKPLREWWRIVRRNVGLVAIAGALGLALSAFVLVPGTAQISDSQRAAVPYSTMQTQDVGLDEFDDIANPVPPDIVTGETIWVLTFIGTPIALLALLGLFTRRPGSGLARTLVIVFGLLLIGSPLTRVAYSVVPGFAYLSPLGRILPFFMFGVVLLGALGADVLRRFVLTRTAGSSRFPRERVAAAMAGVLLVLTVVEAWQIIRYTRDINPPFQPRSAADLFPRTGMIEALFKTGREDVGRGDVQRLVPVRGGSPDGQFSPPPLVGEAARLFTFENIGGYMNVMPPRSRTVARVLSGEPEAQAVQPAVGAYAAFFFSEKARFDLLERLGVDTIVAGPDIANDRALDTAAQELGAEVRYSDNDGTVLHLPDAAPRAFVVDGVETAASTAAALERFTARDFPFRSTVLLDGPASRGIERRAASGPVGATVRVRPTSSERRVMDVDSPRAGWLVVLDSWDKGWSARVGGREVPIQRADFAFRAVQVPAGRSVVEMQYTTPGLRLGVAITLVGLLAAAVLLGAPALRRMRRA